jgi:hypothetical protein
MNGILLESRIIELLVDCVGKRSEWCTVRDNGVNGAKIEKVG